ncbi:MAG: hypothetical protein HY530_00855 [Chloroflexi bacterium]|nr:hypothetical protein [Chloroflexota bacterium]
MITTITTTTITTITSIAGGGITAALGIAVVVMLIFLLTTKEVAVYSGSGSSLRVAKFCSVGIIPMLLAFAVIVAAQILQLLS